jgi:hypothetical protein
MTAIDFYPLLLFGLLRFYASPLFRYGSSLLTITASLTEDTKSIGYLFLRTDRAADVVQPARLNGSLFRSNRDRKIAASMGSLKQYRTYAAHSVEFARI